MSYDKITYTYDSRGNILSKTYLLDDATVDTVTYSYTDTVWNDRLTNYGGTTITYDEIGNPLNWTNGATMTWQHGRQLASYNRGIYRVSYRYNQDGIRTLKTVNGLEYHYTVVDGTLRRLKIGQDTLEFINGTSVIFNGTEYWYVFNAQNDVIGIIDANGTYVVEYTYDSWGQILTKTGSLVDSLGYLNPFRYRGYIYDEETGLYYCQTRYYDPAVGRWLNADGYLSVGVRSQDQNAYRYGDNSPVNTADYTGEDAIWLQDSDNVGSLGHTGLLLQDENGDWYHYYWGMGKSIFLTIGTPNISITKMDTTFSYDSTTVLQQASCMLDGDYDYESHIYFKGDFTASLKYLNDIKNNQDNYYYGLFTNNCMQTCVDALNKGTFEGPDWLYKLSLLRTRSVMVPNISKVRLDNTNKVVTMVSSWCDSVKSFASDAKKGWDSFWNSVFGKKDT